MPNYIIRRSNDEKWWNPRITYLKKIIKPLPQTCPECDSQLTESMDGDETYCTQCGLVTSASIEYAAGVKIDLPYGRH